MATDQLLMGLGMSSMLAARLCDTSGSITVAAAGSSNATGYVVRGTQFTVFVGSGTGWVVLPTVGGSDNAAQIGDTFNIANGLGGSCTIGIPTGVTVNLGGTAYTGSYTLTTLKTFYGFPVSTTQWCATAG
jgi:hypothetical protein